MLLFVPCAIALRKQTPRGSQLLPTAAGFRFTCTTAVRMVDRIARDTTVNRANATMTRTSRFAEDDIFVLRVADLTDGRVAIFVDATDFARRKADLRVAFVARHQSGSASSGPDHLSTTAGRQFNVVNR